MSRKTVPSFLEGREIPLLSDLPFKTIVQSYEARKYKRGFTSCARKYEAVCEVRSKKD